MSRSTDRSLTLCQSANNRLQRTVMDKVPRHERQRAAAEPELYLASFPMLGRSFKTICQSSKALW